MEYICVYNKFGYCKMKSQCEKYHVNEECKEGSECKNLTICPLRHPKMCKRMVMNDHCVFQEKCAYKHKRKTNSQITEINTLHEEVKFLKAEIDTLKTNFKPMLAVRAEVTLLQESVKVIKEDIKMLTAMNESMSERIKDVEEEMKYETDEESDIDNDQNISKFEDKLINEKKVQYINCFKCDFVCNTEMSMKKHTNTKHPIQNNKENEIKSKEIGYDLEGMESIEDLFQLEVLDGEEIYACNVCDQGFDNEDKTKNHIADNHKEIMIEISKFMDTEVES